MQGQEYCGGLALQPTLKLIRTLLGRRKFVVVLTGEGFVLRFDDQVRYRSAVPDPRGYRARGCSPAGDLRRDSG